MPSEGAVGEFFTVSEKNSKIQHSVICADPRYLSSSADATLLGEAFRLYVDDNFAKMQILRHDIEGGNGIVDAELRIDWNCNFSGLDKGP